MGVSSSIPYDKLYAEWRSKKCARTMPIYRYGSKLGVIHVEENMDLDFSKLPDALAFYVVVYSKPWYHVALLLYKPYNPVMKKPTMEYIDSMASPGPSPQGYFEFRAHHEAKTHGILYLGTEYMYGYVDKFSGNYQMEPPQNIENFLANNPNRSMVSSYKESLVEYKQEEIPDDGRLQKYLDALVSFDGGDCEFWAHHIASEMIVHDMSSRGWMTEFTTEVAQTPTMITRYVIQNILYSLGQCVMKHRD